MVTIDFGTDRYEVMCVMPCVLEEGIVRDTIIKSESEELLNEIADKYCQLGYNVQYNPYECCYEALYGILDEYESC